MNKAKGGRIVELPYVSVVIPVLNGEGFIRRCLDSLIRLDYPKTNFEVLFVDNGSTDRTVEIIRKFQSNNPQVKLHFERIKSSYAARNLGVMNSKGQIIAFTDVDCAVNRDWLINLVKGFSKDSIGGIAGEILPEYGDSLVERYSVKAGFLSQKRTLGFEFLPYPQTANVAYRKELFYKIGYFDSIISGGDADFAWRVQLETDYKILYAQDAIVFHRHRTNLKGLFKQQFRYGYGTRLLYERYKNHYIFHNQELERKSGITENINKMINSLKQIKLYLTLSVSKTVTKKADDLLLFEPLLSLVSLCGYRLGGICFTLRLLENRIKRRQMPGVHNNNIMLDKIKN